MTATGTEDLATESRLVRAVVFVVAALSLAAVVDRHRDDPALAVALGVLVALLGVASAIDVAELRIPNRITHPLALVTTALALGAVVVEGRVTAGIAAVGAGLAFALVFLVGRFGLGDVKLSYSLGIVAALLGVPALTATLFVTALTGGLASAVIMAVHRRRNLAFGYGPFLALGSVAGMLVA